MPSSRSLRVVMLVFNEVGRGTYYRALGFARGLAARGHDVSLLAMSRTRRWGYTTREESGVTIVECPDCLWGPLRSGWDPVETLARVGWLRGRTFDIVHAFEARPTVIFPAMFAARSGATLVMDWCDWFGAGGSVEMRPNPLVRAVLRPVESWFEERFRTRARATTVINTVLGEKAVALGVEPATVLLLPNGADRQRLRPIERHEARRALGIVEDHPWIGYVGSAFPDDTRLMAASFEAVHRARPDVRLARLGEHTYSIAPHLRQAEAIIEPGRRLSDEELNLYMAACDLFWLPLVNSGANQGRMPMKLTDYLSVGRPIVATRVGDIEKLFEEIPLGRLAHDTPEDVARQTLALLEEAKGERARYESGARALLEERFNWERLTIELEATYFRALEHCP